MNLIILCRNTRGTSHIALSVPLLSMLALSAVAVVIGCFGLGYSLARSAGFVPADERLGELRLELAEQKAALARAQDNARDDVRALRLRLGSLNAHVIRINALGGRLASMARLDDGEFDFSAPPGIGGPEDPPAAGSASADLTTELDALGARLENQERQLSMLSALLVDRKLSAAVQPRGRPVRTGYISSHFGRRIDPFTGEPRQHRGIDFAARKGAEIVAVATGVVTWTGYRQGYGRMVEINHGNGYVTRYAHNSENLVAVGDQVEQGQTIALMGATGRATGSNLHFEVWYRDRPVDPQRFISERT
ncbi:MAG: M23 family metallopeptidase [Gammaproteobacteria bacterium]|nr:M23 family metallopeptidase [Gammaproteobacteria bacterium]